MNPPNLLAKAIRQDCDDCEFLAHPKTLDLRRLRDHGRLSTQRLLPMRGGEVKCCIWGVGLKALVLPESKRRCELKTLPSPGAEDWRRALKGG